MHKAVEGLVFTLVFYVLCASFAHAVPISDLFGGASITVGDDVEFIDWTLFGTSRVWRTQDGDTPVETGVDVSLINVEPLLDEPLNPGLNFSAEDGSGLSASDPDDRQGSTEILEMVFGYKIRTLDDSARIKDTSLELLDDFLGSTLYSIKIMETLGGSQGGVGANEVYSFDDGSDGVTELLLDTELFSPQAFLYVTTTIRLAAAGQGPDSGYTKLNSFQQRFSETAIPEPNTLALMCLGLVTGVGYRRYRRNAIT